MGDSLRPAEDSGPDVVCFGFLTHSLLLMVEDLPPPNGGAAMKESVETVGDDAAIISCILTNWGVRTNLISSPFGDDYYGHRIREHLESWGVDAGQRLVEGFETPLEVAILDAQGGRTYFQRREPSALAELRAPGVAELAGAGMLYVDWYDGKSVAEAAATASALGVPVFVNLESRYEEEASRSGLLPHASICQVSMDEPEATGRPEDIARSLIDRGVGTVLVTQGERGSLVAGAGWVYRVRSPAVEIVDCFGAGAAYSAAAIYGMRNVWPLERVARFAAAYSGLKCEVSGIAGLTIAEIQKTADTLESTRSRL